MILNRSAWEDFLALFVAIIVQTGEGRSIFLIFKLGGLVQLSGFSNREGWDTFSSSSSNCGGWVWFVKLLTKKGRLIILIFKTRRVCSIKFWASYLDFQNGEGGFKLIQFANLENGQIGGVVWARTMKLLWNMILDLKQMKKHWTLWRTKLLIQKPWTSFARGPCLPICRAGPCNG